MVAGFSGCHFSFWIDLCTYVIAPLHQPVGERDPVTGLPVGLPMLSQGRSVSPVKQQNTEVNEDLKERTGSSNAAAVQGEQGGSSNDTLLKLIQSIQRQQQEQAEQSRQWQRDQAEQDRLWKQTMAQQIADLRTSRGTAGTQAHSATLSTAANEVQSHAAAALRTPISTRVSGLYEQAERGAARTLFAQPEDDAHQPRQLGKEEQSTTMRVKDVLDMVAKFVKPFHGSTELDKGLTVASFVLNIETVMGNVAATGVATPPHVRADVPARRGTALAGQPPHGAEGRRARSGARAGEVGRGCEDGVHSGVHRCRHGRSVARTAVDTASGRRRDEDADGAQHPVRSTCSPRVPSMHVERRRPAARTEVSRTSWPRATTSCTTPS